MNKEEAKEKILDAVMGNFDFLDCSVVECCLTGPIMDALNSIEGIFPKYKVGQEVFTSDGDNWFISSISIDTEDNDYTYNLERIEATPGTGQPCSVETSKEEYEIFSTKELKT